MVNYWWASPGARQLHFREELIMANYETFSCQPSTRWGTDACKGEDGYPFRFNVEVNPVQGVAPHWLSPLYRKDDGSDYYSVHCPQCGKACGLRGKPIRGAVTKTACEAVCQTATSSVCRCSCGGSHHGIR